MGKYVTDWPVGLELSRSGEKGTGLKSLGEEAKKKAGFFFRILVFKSREFQYYSQVIFFRCVMTDSSVESLNDEELLMYYETTKKLLKSRIKDEASKNGKAETLQQKLECIEDELKSRSLWGTE
jgi:hypothetical protein